MTKVTADVLDMCLMCVRTSDLLENEDVPWQYLKCMVKGSLDGRNLCEQRCSPRVVVSRLDWGSGVSTCITFHKVGTREILCMCVPFTISYTDSLFRVVLTGGLADWLTEDHDAGLSICQACYMSLPAANDAHMYDSMYERDLWMPSTSRWAILLLMKTGSRVLWLPLW